MYKEDRLACWIPKLRKLSATPFTLVTVFLLNMQSLSDERKHNLIAMGNCARYHNFWDTCLGQAQILFFASRAESLNVAI